MSGHGSINAAKREEVAMLLATGRSTRKAAEMAGISRHTVWRWQTKNAAFVAQVRELRSAMFKRASGMLLHGTARAAARLAELVKSDDERISLSAARSLLGLTKTVQEAVDFDERLAAIEQRLEGKGGGR
jgi:hypothetical protein